VFAVVDDVDDGGGTVAVVLLFICDADCVDVSDRCDDCCCCCDSPVDAVSQPFVSSK
jgi:hypothetical protein